MMIKVELRAPVERYECVATMTVDDEGNYFIDDPDSRFPTRLHVLLPAQDEQRGFDKVTLDEDAATWARNLHTVLRSGHLIPVVIRDDEGGVARA